MKFESIKAGMQLYSVAKNNNAFRSYKYNVWPVYIKETDLERRNVFASWNGNKPEWFSERVATKWRLKNPNNKPRGMG